jgi:hypothetical protein
MGQNGANIKVIAITEIHKVSVNIHSVPEGQDILPPSAYCYSALLTFRFCIYKYFFEFLCTFSCATFSKKFILFCSIT